MGNKKLKQRISALESWASGHCQNNNGVEAATAARLDALEARAGVPAATPAKAFSAGMRIGYNAGHSDALNERRFNNQQQTYEDWAEDHFETPRHIVKAATSVPRIRHLRGVTKELMELGVLQYVDGELQIAFSRIVGGRHGGAK